MGSKTTLPARLAAWRAYLMSRKRAFPAEVSYVYALLGEWVWPQAGLGDLGLSDWL